MTSRTTNSWKSLTSLSLCWNGTRFPGFSPSRRRLRRYDQVLCRRCKTYRRPKLKDCSNSDRGLVAKKIYIAWLPWSTCYNDLILHSVFLPFSPFYTRPFSSHFSKQRSNLTMSSNNSDHLHDKATHGHNELSRQMTLQLSPDQYERLFFQPSAPKGDLAKRLGEDFSLPI
jgi:hypothetical protein